VLVAHPDDEAIGCGALLSRMHSSVVVFATDGAPRDASFWQKYGSRDAYAQARREEAHRVAAFAGVDEVRFLAQGGAGVSVDQELFHNLPAALDELRKTIRETRPDALLTLAYEGGHPDHDCCNFMTAMLAPEFRLPAWEMPLYYRDDNGEIRRQQFLAGDAREFVYSLSLAEQMRKQAMLALYRSQRAALKEFTVAHERFRPLPVSDYSRPPHGGQLNYEAWGWSVSGREVAAAFCGCLEHVAGKLAAGKVAVK
jgi:LmbE family N-acetylglucosaminyl deacetylase